MYNHHPTIINCHSSLSVSEQVIWVREIASEEMQWVFGRLIKTPMPISHEKSVAQLSILISCASAYSIIRLKIEYAPSSEPDAGERRVPYLDRIRDMLKPIISGIGRNNDKQITESDLEITNDINTHPDTKTVRNIDSSLASKILQSGSSKYVDDLLYIVLFATPFIWSGLISQSDVKNQVKKSTQSVGYDIARGTLFIFGSSLVIFGAFWAWKAIGCAIANIGQILAGISSGTFASIFTGAVGLAGDLILIGCATIVIIFGFICISKAIE